VIVFIIGTVRPINLGALALVMTFLVGTIAAGESVRDMYAGFPIDLLLLLVGVTYLFAIALSNGTVERTIEAAARLVDGRRAAIPWIVFVVASLPAMAGALGSAGVALLAPLALGLARRYGIDRRMIGLMVVHGAGAGNFSPLNVLSGVVTQAIGRGGLAMSATTLFVANVIYNVALAVVIFLVFGGLRPRSADSGTGAVPGDPRTRSPLRIDQVCTLVALVAVAVAALGFGLNIGFVALAAAVALQLAFPKSSGAAESHIAWSVVLLVCGIVTYVAALQRYGTVDVVGRGIAASSTPLVTVLLLCAAGAVTSAFASSAGILGALIPLAVPVLAQGTLDPTGVVVAMAISATVVDSTPFSTVGALVVANTDADERPHVYRGLLAWGGVMVVSAPLITWLLFVVSGAAGSRGLVQTPAIQPVDERLLRETAGAYQWESNGFVYLQLWKEFSGFDKPSQLVAFDEGGDVRVLYPADRDRFVVGRGVAVPAPVEARVAVERDVKGAISALTWTRDGTPPRRARRVASERHEAVQFSNGDVRLAGTLISPAAPGKHPAIILVHGSGAEDREFILPWARFLVRRGVAVLGYDKRGVGGSTGDWNAASFEDLAGDVVAAFQYLETRGDIDATQIGMLGVSQAGWIMPLAATRATRLAFMISIAGAGVPPAETTIDHAQNEMTASGMKPQIVAEIIALMKLQYRFARTGEGWNEYADARRRLASRLGQPPPTMPGTPDHPSWQSIRRTYFFDPALPLRELKVPVLALFGALDNNILAEKNLAAWDAALKAGGHPDYTLRILAGANHYLWEAKTGSNAEMASLQRFMPEYFTIIHDWLAKRIRLAG